MGIVVMSGVALTRKTPESGGSQEYTELEYIQNSGNNHIDTGYVPNNNTRIVTEVSIDPSEIGDGYFTVYGCTSSADYDDSTANFFESGIGTMPYSDMVLNYHFFYYGTQGATANTDYNIYTTKFTIDQNKTQFAYSNYSGSYDLYDYVEKTDVVGTSFEAQTFTTVSPLTFFALNGTNGIFSVSSAGVRIYSSKIYNNGVLVRDFIPCEWNTGETGLYDKVEDKFYPFLISEIVEPEEPEYEEFSLSSLTEGQEVRIQETNGNYEKFYVAKHNYENSSSMNGNGRTLLVRSSCYACPAKWNSTGYNQYASGDLDVYLNGEYLNDFSSEVQSLIGTTKFKYTPMNDSTSVSTLSRSVFILSLTEYGLYKSGYLCNNEGSALPISSLILDGYIQFTRTPATDSYHSIYYVSTSNTAQTCSSSNTMNIRPCFTLPASAKFYIDSAGKLVLKI